MNEKGLNFREFRPITTLLPSFCVQGTGTVFMRNGLDLLLLVLCLTTAHSNNGLFALANPGASDELSNGKYHTSTSEVRLLFFVTDRHNQPVEELRQDDLVVIDNEIVIRHFRSFSSAARAKLDVMILIDTSDSVLPQLPLEIASVLQLISQWPEGNVSVLSFSGMESHSICAGSCRSALTADLIASIPQGGATPLFDAVKLASALLIERQQPDTRPVIILFSDGQDTISKASFHEAWENALTGGMQIYAIDLNDPRQPSNGSATLQRLADDTGGRRISIGEGTVGILEDVLDDLHTARVITYAPPESISDFHSVRILPTHNLNLQFRSRRGYYHRSSSSH